MNIVWFKRDLRVYDNAALTQAAKEGSFIPLFIYEPSVWINSNLGSGHRKFLFESLHDLNADLSKLGQPLVFRKGECLEVFSSITKMFDIKTVFSYEETWSYATYKRDVALKDWFRTKKIGWREFPRNGVVRGLKSRSDWSKIWKSRMDCPPGKAPVKLIRVEIKSDRMPGSESIWQGNSIDFFRKSPGGRRAGENVLNSFVTSRHQNYKGGISSPNSAFNSSSRLSPYLAFGIFSIKEIIHAMRLSNSNEYITEPTLLKRSRASLRSFMSRLKWHCHFIQKLEDQPTIELYNLHPSTNMLEREYCEKKFMAWQNGMTGYPFLDACMRCLITTGWINFRMRAMLMSFSSYHLWLPWQQSASYLASLFIDFEPGIHYPQCQMQSGTTGINTIRIYNPFKQSVDHDPDGIFIKKWIPELRDIEPENFSKPSLIAKKTGYPSLIVDEKESRQKAAEKIYRLKQNGTFQKEARKIFLKHGSRKRNFQKRKAPKLIEQQKSFEF